MTLVIASNNKDKLREIREILDGTGISVISQSEAGCHFEAEENGATFTENARIKAKAALAATGLPCVADDSGIEIDALDGGPGIYSSRYVGDRTYAETCREIIKIADEKGVRGCRFVCAVVCVFPDGREITALGKVEGTVAKELKGEGGFGYDPMFYLEHLGKTMAELSEDEKNSLSHRGRAFREFAGKLKETGIC
ncbi:MAG: RdgB/HAM1 family non-canonical purine NTP pyrophosphatase [Oscillospiraceae bacterium]|nr:RdgB/HAM1 family non-canonical purine NTP pyrophosphatase [Oscillospiraceae bacterium]